MFDRSVAPTQQATQQAGRARRGRRAPLGAVAVALGVLAGVLAMSACDGDSPANPEDSDTATFDYKGGNLVCVWTGRSASCDFDTFYAKHADLLTVDASTVTGADDLNFVRFCGQPLTCVWTGQGASCDFVEFYAKHPEFLGATSTVN